MKGSLKPRRGVTQSITVHSEADADTVLREAVRKLTAYGYIEPGEYYLVYPVSYTRVMAIPGEDTPFTEQRYKDDMGAVQFSRVRLFLVAAQDYTTEAKPTGEYTGTNAQQAVTLSSDIADNNRDKGPRLPKSAKTTSGAFKIGKVSRIFLPVLSFSVKK